MSELAVVLIAAAIVQKVVERIREMVPALDGNWVNLVAAALGVGCAFAAGFDVLHGLTAYDWPWWLDRLITGVGIGAGAGFFADLAGRSGPRAETGGYR